MDGDNLAMLFEYLSFLQAPSQSVYDTSEPGTWWNHWRTSHTDATAFATPLEQGWTAEACTEVGGWAPSRSTGHHHYLR